MFPIAEHRRIIDPPVTDPGSQNLDNKENNPTQDHEKKKEGKHQSKVTSLRFKMNIEKIASKVQAIMTEKDISKPTDQTNKKAKGKDKEKVIDTDKLRDKDRLQRRERLPKVHFHLGPNPQPQSS